MQIERETRRRIDDHHHLLYYTWRHTNINVADFLHTLRIQTLQPHGEQHLPMVIWREMLRTILVKSQYIARCSSKSIWLLFEYSK